MATKLHVSNLNYATTQETLQAAFAADGRRVESIAIQMGKATGQPRGFAYVQFATEADAQSAITALHGKEIDGRVIKVTEARGRVGARSPD